MKTFKHIVVATDFSESSANAYRYARQVAARFGATLKVVHIYEIPVNPSHPEYFNFMPSLEELENTAKQRLANFISESDEGNNTTVVASRIKVTSEALIGFPADRLIELSKDPSVDLLILGTYGEHGLMDRIFGSVSVKVASEAYCPVLLIPEDADYTGIHHALYAASFDSITGKEISVAIDFAKYFVSALHFVHVDTGKTEAKPYDRLALKRLLEQKAPKLPYSLDSIEAKSIADGIYQYSLKNEVDVIMTVTRHRNFWESLTHHSVTKDLTWRAELPILCLHSDDQIQPPT
jgi:nucleotide-binding universal stress UspA family protein